jgi:hypothetical protein
MLRRTLALLSLAACHPAASTGSVDDPVPSAPPGERDGARAQVQLTWRLFETRRWLDGHDKHESAVVELLVNGGVPSRVDLGRRDTAGCAVTDASETAGAAPGVAITSLDCAVAHAQVFANVGELRVVAGDRGVTRPADSPMTHERTATVRVPVGAELAVDRVLARIPDEAPGP